MPFLQSILLMEVLRLVPFSGSPITNLGFDNKIINDGGFGHPGSSNQQISLASLDAMNTYIF